MNIEVRGREAWGARPPKWRGTVSNSQGIFIHYNGGPVPANVLAGDPSAVAAFLRSTQNFHMDHQGWPDIAYSWCVSNDGRGGAIVWDLRGWGTEGAHTLNWNERSHAIFFPIGGDQAPTDAQVAAARFIVAEHARRYGGGFVKGHREAPNSTSCPGEPTMGLIRAGRFTPSSGDVVAPPSPPGVDVQVNKPEMVREPNGTVWMFYSGSPWRSHVKTPADVQTFQFFGVPFKGVDQRTADFLRRNSQEVKCK